MSRCHFFSDNCKDFLFSPADLYLRHIQDFCCLCLRFTLIVPQFYNLFVTAFKVLNRLFKAKPFGDFVLNIVNRHVKLWVSFLVIFGGERERISHAVECVNYLFGRSAELFRKLGNSQLATVFQLVFVVDFCN